MDLICVLRLRFIHLYEGWSKSSRKSGPVSLLWSCKLSLYKMC